MFPAAPPFPPRPRLLFFLRNRNESYWKTVYSSPGCTSPGRLLPSLRREMPRWMFLPPSLPGGRTRVCISGWSTAREGHRLREIEKLVWEEIRALTTTPPAPREVERAVNQIEASFLDRLESVQMKAELLSMYVAATGNPDYLNEDLARYKAIDPGDIQAMTATYLRADGCVVLSVFPLGKPELAAPKEGRP